MTEINRAFTISKLTKFICVSRIDTQVVQIFYHDYDSGDCYDLRLIVEDAKALSMILNDIAKGSKASSDD